ncbi:MAG: hypothetical protein ACAF42_03810 [Limnothrix sp. BL-A-16]
MPQPPQTRGLSILSPTGRQRWNRGMAGDRAVLHCFCTHTQIAAVDRSSA